MEEEVNYASVVFKTNKASSPPANLSASKEETVYDEVKARNEASEQTAGANDSAGSSPDQKENEKRRHCQLLACCLGFLCVILVLGIVGVSVYLTLFHESEQDQLRANQTTLLAANQNLTNLNMNLRTENENLMKNLSNLTVQFKNLTQDYNVLEEKNSNLTARIQELETEKKNLTQQITDMETERNQLNVSQAQWSIDAYCPKDNNVRQCKPCQGGWNIFQSSCFAFNNPNYPGQKTWEEARENCRGKSSDLAVIVNEAEKNFLVTDGSWTVGGFWIGLRAEGGKWKWLDGSEPDSNRRVSQDSPTTSRDLKVLRADLIHPGALPPAELTPNYLSDFGLGDGRVHLRESPASCFLIGRQVGGIEEILEVFLPPSWTMSLSREKIEEEPASPKITVKKMTASSEKVQEEADYVNAAVCTVEKKEVTSVTSVISENNTKLTEENQQLQTLINKFNTENENLMKNLSNLTVQFKNLTKDYDFLEEKITNLTARNQQLETERNELNVIRAQWSIDAYCRIDNARKCEPCQKGWVLFQSSCFAFINPPASGQKTWEEARENCRGTSSDLAVIVNEAEKNFLVTDGSWTVGGFWIGLRAEGGKWKWLDGSDLTETMDRKHLETADQKFLSFTRSFAAVAVCWLTLSVIMALRIYFTSVISENNTKLTEENQQLKTLMQHLNNQTDTTLTAENQNLKTQIQELVTERDTLTQQITDMETERIELNVSRAQWSIDAYCPKDNNERQCKVCTKGWLHSQSSCYAFNDADTPDQKTWEEARENCRGKSSDLAVIVNEAEKNFIRNWGDGGFWIGLRAKGGKWKWLDGSDLTETLWIPQQPAADGLCVISVPYDGWQSVSCGEKQQWICQIKALSV
ncbi:hypothetical protein L3Q82_012945 [Scortum barcoo]|uniref:Uncharacterized protein n=1 Tax=Scortum barcoo TaxID=214431 RepID=A0ACB8W2P2_9TELE|nr:hypothetical protein L3Q82_012945 [Scortum barcoo]